MLCGASSNLNVQPSPKNPDPGTTCGLATPAPLLGVICDAAREHDAHTLARSLGARILGDNDNADYVLHLTCDRLELLNTAPGAPGPIYAEFMSGKFAYRQRHGNATTENLARAIGLRKNPLPYVIDATAGLGADGFMLASFGCRVTMLERSPLVAALLRDGLDRAREHPSTRAVGARISLHVEDAVSFLDALADSDRPDAVYLDPMFPPRGKSALVKKEMQVLQEIAGERDDEDALFRAARKAARRRVVVKRHRLKEPLCGKTADFAIEGRSTRFDVYLVAR